MKHYMLRLNNNQAALAAAEAARGYAEVQCTHSALLTSSNAVVELWPGGDISCSSRDSISG